MSPWKNEAERKADQRAAVKDAAKEAARGNFKDAKGILKSAKNNKDMDPDTRVGRA